MIQSNYAIKIKMSQLNTIKSIVDNQTPKYPTAHKVYYGPWFDGERVGSREPITAPPHQFRPPQSSPSSLAVKGERREESRTTNYLLVRISSLLRSYVTISRRVKALPSIK